MSLSCRAPYFLPHPGSSPRVLSDWSHNSAELLPLHIPPPTHGTFLLFVDIIICACNFTLRFSASCKRDKPAKFRSCSCTFGKVQEGHDVDTRYLADVILALHVTQVNLIPTNKMKPNFIRMVRSKSLGRPDSARQGEAWRSALQACSILPHIALAFSSCKITSSPGSVSSKLPAPCLHSTVVWFPFTGLLLLCLEMV